MESDDARAVASSALDARRRTLRLQGISFFVLGLLNNMMYVIILTAALELLPSHVPTGLLAFFNITPAVAAKAIFPYMLKGEIQYTTRVWSCTLLAFLGMSFVAMFDVLVIRLCGIAVASFASGLGEITYLQYATRYPQQITSHCVGWFASGTGAAGLVGASAWWIVRPLGVRKGLGVLACFAFGTAIAFFLVLPKARTEAPATALLPPNDATEALMAEQGPEDDAPSAAAPVHLSTEDKLRLLKPMLIPYVLPLVCVHGRIHDQPRGGSYAVVYGPVS